MGLGSRGTRCSRTPPEVSLRVEFRRAPFLVPAHAHHPRRAIVCAEVESMSQAMRSVYIRMFFALVQACAAALLCSESWAWQRNINGTADALDEARAVAVDSAGNVVAAGFTTNAGTGQDFTVIKFSGLNGTELWRRNINGPTNDGDAASAIAVDAAGDVLAAGTVGRTGLDRDFFVVKLSGSDGTERWRKTINGSANSDDMALAVAVDAAGNVLAAGLVTNIGTDADFTVVKFDGSSGVELWRKSIDGSALFSADAAFAVTVDAAGDVLAAGRTQNEGAGWDFTVVKFSALNGTELWRQVIDGTSNDRDEAFAVAVDNAGDVVVAGGIVNDTGFVEFAVIKFAGAVGTEQWRQMIPGPSDHPDFPAFPSEARAVKVNGAGDVVAAGVTEFGLPIYKFSGVNGTVLWSNLVFLTSSSALALDAAGDVVSAGSSLGISNYEFNVIKFAGADGAVLWRRDIDGAAHFRDLARAIAVDSTGNVVVAGVTSNAFDDFAVVKLRGTDGAGSLSVTRADFNGDIRSDILWRNAASGENYLYPMDGKTILGTEGLPAHGGGPELEGGGDRRLRRRRQGRRAVAEFLDGENYIYFMDGRTSSRRGLPRTVADQNWQVAGIGDFNGDGKDDILWRNTATGENYVYPMDGLTILGTEGYLRTVADLNWEIVGVGDFDGDGKADILWRNSATGQNYLYPMNGTAICRPRAI